MQCDKFKSASNAIALHHQHHVHHEPNPQASFQTWELLLASIKSEMMLEVEGTRQIMMQMMEMMQRMLVMQNAEGIGTLTQPEKTHVANDANAGDAE